MQKPVFLPAEIDNLLKVVAVAFWVVVIVALLGLAWRGLTWAFHNPGLTLGLAAVALIVLFVVAELRRPFRGSKHV